MVDKLSTWETSLSSQGLFRPGFDVCQSLGCSRHITNNLHIVISITSICWTHFWVRVMSDNKSFSAWVQKTKLYVSADSSFFWFLTFPTALWVKRGGLAVITSKAESEGLVRSQFWTPDPPHFLTVHNAEEADRAVLSSLMISKNICGSWTIWAASRYLVQRK